MPSVPFRVLTSSALPLRSEHGIVMLTFEWNSLIMKAVQRWVCCWAHARDRLGWRRIARVGTARISLQQPTLLAHSKTCRHILLAGQHLAARAQNLNVHSFYPRAVTPPCCHVGLHVNALLLTDGTQTEGHSVWGGNVKSVRRVYNDRIILEKRANCGSTLEKVQFQPQGSRSKRLSYLTGNTDWVFRVTGIASE